MAWAAAGLALAGAVHRRCAVLTGRARGADFRRGLRTAAVWGLIAGVGAAGGVRPARAADDDAPLATAVKAAFLYKFQLYVQWPAAAFAGPASAFNFCVLGPESFAHVLERALRGQMIGSHPAVAVRLPSVAANTACQVLYVDGPNAAFARTQLELVAGRPVLTVTDAMPDGARGVINFVIADDHVRFEIDNEAAMRNGLALSSKLLHIAIAVHQHGEPTQ